MILPLPWHGLSGFYIFFLDRPWMAMMMTMTKETRRERETVPASVCHYCVIIIVIIVVVVAPKMETFAMS